MVVAAVVVVLAAAALAVLGFLLVSRYIPARWLVADTDAAGALYATIGMVYAILIAIAAIAVWEPRTGAAQNTDLEAASLTEAYWSANALAPGDRGDVQQLVEGYLRVAAGSEWMNLRLRKAGTPEADQLFTRLRQRVDAIEPQTDKQVNASQAVAAQIAQAAGARRARLAAATEGMPEILWPILILGGFISVMFLYLFGLERTFPNGLMLAVVGGMVALLLLVLYQVEYPFSRAFAVGPGSFEAALDNLRPSAAPGGS